MILSDILFCIVRLVTLGLLFLMLCAQFGNIWKHYGKNGFEKTRKAIFWLTLSLVINLTVLTIPDIHILMGNTDQVKWDFFPLLEPLLFFSRVILLIAVIKFYKLLLEAKK